LLVAYAVSRSSPLTHSGVVRSSMTWVLRRGGRARDPLRTPASVRRFLGTDSLILGGVLGRGPLRDDRPAPRANSRAGAWFGFRRAAYFFLRKKTHRTLLALFSQPTFSPSPPRLRDFFYRRLRPFFFQFCTAQNVDPPPLPPTGHCASGGGPTPPPKVFFLGAPMDAGRRSPQLAWRRIPSYRPLLDFASTTFPATSSRRMSRRSAAGRNVPMGCPKLTGLFARDARLHRAKRGPLLHGGRSSKFGAETR